MINYQLDTRSDEFWKTLQDRVKRHFISQGLSTHANFAMKIKIVAVLLLFIAPVLLIYFSTLPLIAKWGLCFIAGLGMAAIGLCISHQAVHGAISGNPTTNRFLGMTFNLLGVSDYLWKIKHNVSHHAFTNIYEMDEALKEGDIIRMSTDVSRKSIHRFQHWYTPIVYALFTIFWTFALDFEKLARYNRDGRVTKSSHSAKEIFIFWSTKIYYILVCFIIPYYFLHFQLSQILIGFFTMHITASLIITHVLQVEHLFDEVSLPKVDQGNAQVSWVLSQLEGTSNFKTNAVFDWFVGGSNYQIEHHLFPRICAIHYPAISEIVRNTAEEYGYRYKRHASFTEAIRSHYKFLKQLGYAA